MKKRNAKSNTGETVKDKRGRTVSDESGGKSLSGKSKSERGVVDNVWVRTSQCEISCDTEQCKHI